MHKHKETTINLNMMAAVHYVTSGTELI